MEPRTWQRTDPTTLQTFLISTDPTLLSIPFIQTAFATSAMYWARPLSPQDMQTMLSHSTVLGLYHVISPGLPTDTIHASQLEQIGMARLITDYVTTAYLTDVYVGEEFRKRGLGAWLAGCCQEVVGGIGQAFRRSLLLTSRGHAVGMYARTMGMYVYEEGFDGLVVMTHKRGVGANADGTPAVE